MQTIQTPSRESTGSSRKLLPLCLMLLLVTSIGFTIYFVKKNDYVPKEYDNADQIISLVENNFEEFNSFLDVIDSTPAFGKVFDKSGRLNIFDYRDLKQYMSEDDYTIVCNFWTKYKPKFMRKNAVIFRTSSWNEIWIFVSDNPEYLKDREQHGELRQLSNNMYCLIYADDN